MSLHDEHLQQALKHAPDKDLAPSDAARSAVLAYANKALKVKPVSWAVRFSNWMQEWFGPSWHSVGLGSAVATVLIVVVVWHGQPDDAIWQMSKPIEESEYKSEDSALVQAPQAASVESQREAAVLAAPSPAEMPPAAKAESAKSAPVSPILASKNDQENLKNSDLAEAVPQVPSLVASAPAPIDQGNAVSADAELTKEIPPEILASSTVLKDNVTAKKLAEKPNMRGLASPKSAENLHMTEATLVRIKNEGGKSVANQDIQAGNFRLIKIETQKKNAETLDCPQIQNQSIAVDATTGFRIESIAICEASGLLQTEVEVYNQTVRDWQSSHLQ